MKIRTLAIVCSLFCAVSSSVSQYEISLDDSPLVRQKSSGVGICTGTGSSSWYYNMHRICPDFMKSILKIAAKVASPPSSVSNLVSSSPCLEPDTFNGLPLEEVAELVTKEYNRGLMFDPTSAHMAYAIRDLVQNRTFDLFLSQRAKLYELSEIGVA